MGNIKGLQYNNHNKQNSEYLSDMSLVNLFIQS